MSFQGFYQLPDQLRAFRLGAGLSQSQFAASIGMDSSRWCALERGRRKLSSLAALEDLLDRVRATQDVRHKLRLALAHDLVIERLSLTLFPKDTVGLVSCCLQAALVLEPSELIGLVATIRSALKSKRELDSLAQRASLDEEDAMT